MRRTISLLAIALATTAISLQAQQQQQQAQQPNRGGLSGVVTDAASRAPLSLANVTIEGTALGTFTDSAGRFTIANMTPGIVTIRVTRVGYTPAIIPNVRIAAGVTTNRVIMLAVQALQLSSLETVRGRAAAALYNQRAGGSVQQNIHYRCDDPLTPRNADCVLVETGERVALALRNEAPYSQFLFAPELVMKHQSQIGLQDAQRTRIIGEMSQAQAKFTEIQWTLSGEEEKLNRLLQGTSPDEQAVIAQMERILLLELNIKRTQLQLLVRIKNVLTPEQQNVLSKLRDQ